MREQQVKITTEFIQLEALLKFTGAVETGGKAKTAIQTGEVQVNGEVCQIRGRKLRPGDWVKFGGVRFTVV